MNNVRNQLWELGFAYLGFALQVYSVCVKMSIGANDLLTIYWEGYLENRLQQRFPI